MLWACTENDLQKGRKRNKYLFLNERTESWQWKEDASFNAAVQVAMSISATWKGGFHCESVMHGTYSSCITDLLAWLYIWGCRLDEAPGEHLLWTSYCKKNYLMVHLSVQAHDVVGSCCPHITHKRHPCMCTSGAQTDACLVVKAWRRFQQWWRRFPWGHPLNVGGKG